MRVLIPLLILLGLLAGCAEHNVVKTPLPPEPRRTN